MPTQRETAIDLLNSCGAFRDRDSAIAFINTLVAFTSDNPATTVDYSTIPEYADNEAAFAALGAGKAFRASAASTSLIRGGIYVTYSS